MASQTSTPKDKLEVAHVVIDTFKKLSPVQMVHNPVMMVVELGTLVTLWFTIRAQTGAAREYNGLVTAILFFTVLFATFAEAYAEARGRAQAEFLRRTKSTTRATVLRPDGRKESLDSSVLQKGTRC
ncbi:MAG: potassium-transporting ATPase subunit B, partial [Firmicutes bacterium]|nr:potassium-transporting ATPase subunit B [Bacillota bacterium]